MGPIHYERGNVARSWAPLSKCFSWINFLMMPYHQLLFSQLFLERANVVDIRPYVMFPYTTHSERRSIERP